MAKDDDDDEFWGIAMMMEETMVMEEEEDETEEGWLGGGSKCNSNYDIEDKNGTEEQGIRGGRRIKYKLPNTTSTSTTILELQPLPANDGIWSQVGADAWYSSAILAAMMFQQQQIEEADDDDDDDDDSLSLSSSLTKLLSLDCYDDTLPFRILELGSGAVGLSGLACCVALQQKQQEIVVEDTTTTTRRRTTKPWKITMTDNDNEILHQLQRNVDYNIPNLRRKCYGNNNSNNNNENHNNIEIEHDDDFSFTVESLDWNSDINNDNNINSPIENIDLVIGSELVYSDATANALMKLLKRILNQNADVEIWIVQVIDRYGWLDIVLPGLMKEEEEEEENCNNSSSEGNGSSISVKSFPIPLEIHDMATKMIPMGGTLDRHAYGAYCIRNNNSNIKTSTTTISASCRSK